MEAIFTAVVLASMTSSSKSSESDILSRDDRLSDEIERVWSFRGSLTLMLQ